MIYSGKKSYEDHKNKDLKFEERDKMYLKISRMKGMVRFFNKGKFSPHFMDPY